MADSFKRFLIAFEEWFFNALPYEKILNDSSKSYRYERYWSEENNCDYEEQIWYISIDFDRLYKLNLGINGFKCTDIFNKTPLYDVNDFKIFIELIYNECVDNRYLFTIEINKLLKRFKINYILQNGKFIKVGYKSTEKNDIIINYDMCERKIQFALNMISSKDLLDKKVALDYIIDALQYLVSIGDGEKVKEKYQNISLSISGSDNNNKMYTVVKTEIEEIMKISNQYFDIRHNEYLNTVNEVREPLKDGFFIEYLFNRAYALLFIIKLKTKISVKEN